MLHLVTMVKFVMLFADVSHFFTNGKPSQLLNFNFIVQMDTSYKFLICGNWLWFICYSFSLRRIES